MRSKSPYPAFLLVLVAAVGVSEAAISIVASEEGSSVIFRISGSTEIAPVSTGVRQQQFSLLNPGAALVTAEDSVSVVFNVWTVGSGPAWGNGSYARGTLIDGERMFFFSNSIYGMEGISSANSTVSFDGTFSSLGLTPGLYTYTLTGGGGATEALTVRIGAVPEPGAAAMSVVAALAFAVKRRRL